MRILAVSYPVQTGDDELLGGPIGERLCASDYDIALFPELMIGGYHARDLWLSKDYLNDCARDLSSIAQIQAEWHASVPPRKAPLWLVGAPHQHKGVCFNAAFVLRKGEIVSVYHKNILASADVFDEYRYFCPGKSLCIFDHCGVRCGLLICEDVWNNDMIERYAAETVELLLVLNASPFEVDKQHRREQRVSIMSHQHRIAFVLNNFCGVQDELIFDGISFAYNADGSLALRSPFMNAGVSEMSFEKNKGIVATIEPTICPVPGATEQTRSVLLKAISSYTSVNGLDEIVVGLSGGIDSAVATCLAAEAIGPKKIHALMIVGPHTSAMSIDLARELAENLSINFRTVDIGSAFQALVQVLRRCYRGRMHDLVRQNLQARLRCTVLAGLANQKNALLLNTTNKSEASVGYGTLYGDLAGGIAPLLDVTKQGVYQLAQLINCQEQIIPDGILVRPPTAELAENQTDEAALMPYSAIDSILYYHLELGLEFSELRTLSMANSAQFDLEQVKRFCEMNTRSEFKRRQSPVTFKLSHSTYSSARRHPLSVRRSCDTNSDKRKKPKPT